MHGLSFSHHLSISGAVCTKTIDNKLYGLSGISGVADHQWQHGLILGLGTSTPSSGIVLA